MKTQLLDHLEVARRALQSAAYIAEAKAWGELAFRADLAFDVEAAKNIVGTLDHEDTPDPLAA
jgi:hypothetical protein